MSHDMILILVSIVHMESLQDRVQMLLKRNKLKNETSPKYQSINCFHLERVLSLNMSWSHSYVDISLIKKKFMKLNLILVRLNLNFGVVIPILRLALVAKVHQRRVTFFCDYDFFFGEQEKVLCLQGKPYALLIVLHNSIKNLQLVEL